MRNKTITILIFITALVGFILTLIQLYAPQGEIPLVIKGSYYYLATPFVLLTLALLIETPISNTLKLVITSTLVLFGFFGLNLSLIALYASPLDYPEPYAAAIFFLAGMLGSAIIPIIKTKKVEEKIELGKVHRIFRITLLIIIVLLLINFIINIVQLLNSI